MKKKTLLWFTHLSWNKLCQIHQENNTISASVFRIKHKRWKNSLLHDISEHCSGALVETNVYAPPPPMVIWACSYVWGLMSKNAGAVCFRSPFWFRQCLAWKSSSYFLNQNIARRWLTLKLLKGMLEVQIIQCCTDEPLLWFPVIESSFHIPPFGTLTFNPCTGMPKIPSAHLQATIKTQIHTCLH